jgi:hypothetical protein
VSCPGVVVASAAPGLGRWEMQAGQAGVAF